MLPSVIANAYYYRLKIRRKEEVHSIIKRKKESGEEGSSVEKDGKKKKEGRPRKMYCINTGKFHSRATKEEMEMDLSFSGELETTDVHRILQCRLRYDIVFKLYSHSLSFL